MKLEILRKLGLSDGEIKVYSALLDMGISSVNGIHEKAGMERRNIYDILNKLIEKGLVTYTEENKKRTYQTTHPSKLISYMDEKKKEIEDSKLEITNEIPLILDKFNSKRPNIQAEVFRGIEGMKAVWGDMLNYKEMYWIGSGRYVPKRYPNFFAVWDRKRVKKRIRVLNLMRYELRPEIKLWQFEQMKFLPKEFSGAPTVIGIYGSKVAHFLYGDDLFVFVIDSKDLAENYKKYHKYLWDNVAEN